MSDTLRERCIEAGRDAMGRNDGWRWWAPRHLEKLLNLWEPMIRADERDNGWGNVLAKYRDGIETDLRVQIAVEIMAAHGGVKCYHAPAKDVPYRVCTHLEDAAIARGETR